MKITFLLENYNWFYSRFFESDEEIHTKLYNDQIAELIAMRYYQSDSLGNELNKIGYSAQYLIPECMPLQINWAKEYNKKLYKKWTYGKVLRSVKSRLHIGNPLNNFMQQILLAQLRESKPDIVFCYSGVWLDDETVTKIKEMGCILVLQWSCPIMDKWKNFSFNKFDFILSSSQNLVGHFKSIGCESFFFQQAFDARDKIKTQPTRNVIFAGSLTNEHHRLRIELIEKICSRFSVDVFTQVKPTMPNTAKCWKGGIAGQQMLNTYGNYKIALHIPGDEFEDDAGAKRLFEVTGVGSLLLTYNQKNISDIFNLSQIITFTDADDCVAKIKHLITNEDERAAIAKNGNDITLTNHTFASRAEQFNQLLNSI
jgi:spore maturation protein CgeB